jgi:hypothetical protein
MHEDYLKAAEIISNLAREYSDDYKLASILRLGSIKITELAQKETGLILKTGTKVIKDTNHDREKIICSG